MRVQRVLLLALLVCSSFAIAGTTANPPLGALGKPEPVAEGVELYRYDGESLTDPPSPQSIRLLRLDPQRVRLSSVLATGEIPGRATVQDIARRTDAIAAVNAGFFSPSGDPNGLLEIDDRLVSDTRRARGAVAVLDSDRGIDLLFDRVTARAVLRVRSASGWRTLPIDGVDTVRGAGRLVLYSPASGPTTDTTGGVEWVLTGRPLKASPPTTSGNSAIPPGGYVVSYGGTAPPSNLAGLARATAVQVREVLDVHSRQRQQDWRRATTLVGGAGLLVRDGKPLGEWAIEGLSKGFDVTRHPRTVIARGADRAIWLVTIDGRQPDRAHGMTFAAMQALLSRLGAVDALNLDGGGSTTMVVRGAVVNRPSDITGPRAVSDALIVTARPSGG